MFYISDFLVIGSGLAGMNFALEVCDFGSVNILTKKDVTQSNTFHAQGGIASVISPGDSYQNHIEDTLKTGAGLCSKEIVEFCVKQGPKAIQSLIDYGVKFSVYQQDENSKDEKSPQYDLAREGGHSRRRILHADDITGQEIHRALFATISKHNNIRLFEDHIAIDLITSGKFGLPGENRCLGAYVLDREKNLVNTFIAKFVILASGGAGKVYLYTSNPDIATGDGIAMAYRAGAQVSNLEFFQFHPTCLYHPQAKSFLISETVRGEGAILKNLSGKSFMEDYHPMGCLAPRDIVARAIDNQMKISGDDFVHLDLSAMKKDFIQRRFPNIFEKCLSVGLDITESPIPVVPAAHYCCGGVLTDTNGATSFPGLLACGEVACTGLHGANRLASNSLLEAVVFSSRAARYTRELLKEIHIQADQVPPWDPGRAVDSDESVVVSHNWDEIRRLMWNYVGIFRSDKRLARAERRIELLRAEIYEYYWDFKITSDLIELRNIAQLAHLIIKSAMWRQESRGLHYNLNYQQQDDDNYLCNSLMQKDKEFPSGK